MKVYVIFEYQYDGRPDLFMTVVATKEEAEERIKAYGGAGYFFEEYDI